jgi:hypothetical protein
MGGLFGCEHADELGLWGERAHFIRKYVTRPWEKEREHTELRRRAIGRI